MGGDSYDNVETPEWARALMVSGGTEKGQTGEQKREQQGPRRLLRGNQA